jgi:hypothetical protein
MCWSKTFSIFVDFLFNEVLLLFLGVFDPVLISSILFFSWVVRVLSFLKYFTSLNYLNFFLHLFFLLFWNFVKRISKIFIRSWNKLSLNLLFLLWAWFILRKLSLPVFVFLLFNFWFEFFKWLIFVLILSLNLLFFFL